MQCTSCGTALSPGTVICPRCGTHLSYTSDVDEIAYVDYGSTEQIAETMPPASQAQENDTHRQKQSSTDIPQERPPINDGLQIDETEQSSQQQSSVDGVQASPVPPAPPAVRQPRSFSVVTVMLLIILVLLLVIGGSGLIFYTTIVNPHALNIQATAVARTVLTNEIQGTIDAARHATATVTALTPQQIYSRATNGLPVINDSLSNPNGSIWPHYVGSDNSCTFLGGAYHIKAYVKASNNTCFAFNGLFNNLAFQVQMTIIKGDAGGLLFHVGQGFYLFLVNQNGSYSLYLGIGILALLASGKSPAINSGRNRSNLLTAVAFDGYIYLYVNKQPLAHAFDSTFSSGQIALFAGSATDITDVAFNNVQVWSI